MNPNSYKSGLSHRLKQTRLKICSESLWAFAGCYLGHIFKLPPSKMHLETIEALQQMISNRDRKFAVTGPYQYLQCELISLAYALWCICYEKEKFILIIADNKEQAKDTLMALKHELVCNKLIKSDFPDATGKNCGQWNSYNTTTRNNVKICAAAFNQKHLNFRHRNLPPSLVILHLPDDHDMTSYKRNSDSWRDWFEKQLARNTHHNTNIIAAGTFAPINDSLLKDIFFHEIYKDWTTKSHAAITSEGDLKLAKRWEMILNEKADYYYKTGPEAAKRFFDNNKKQFLENTKVLWPEHEDYCDLIQQRLFMPRDKFEHYKLNKVNRKYSAIQQAMINLTAGIASNLGATFHIPNDCPINVNALLKANGINYEFDFDEYIMNNL